MNQTQATEKIANALHGAWIFDDIQILTPTEGSHPSVILAKWDDTHLSVTVEILAQP